MTEKAKPNKKLEAITSGDIGTLSTSLTNKSYVHELPTTLLIRAHNRIELEHLLDPRNHRLQIAHTNLFKEMELREIDHFDTDPNFFTPSNIKWPFEFEGEDFTIEVFTKKEERRKKSKTKSGKNRKAPKTRFKKAGTEKAPKKKRWRLYRKKAFKEDIEPSKPTVRLKIDRANLIEKHSAAIDWASLLVGDDETKRIFKEKAVATWNIQPDTGNIPTGNGPRPKKEHWYKTLWPPMGAYQAFMQKTLSAFYRKQTPPWAIQEWDIELTVTNGGGSDNIRKERFIQTKIDPN